MDGGGTVPDKVTLQISGVGLPGAASEYLCEGTIQDTYERVQIPAESVTPPNQYGYRFVTFDLRGHNLQNTSWNNIEFDGGTYTDQDGSHQVENYGAFFFDPRSHLKQEKNESGATVYLPEFRRDLDKVDKFEENGTFILRR